MMKSFIRRGFVLIIILGLVSCTVANRNPHTYDLNLKKQGFDELRLQVHDSIEKAVKFLCDRQTTQGCWRFKIERTGDELNDEALAGGRGPGITSLVLYALVSAPPDIINSHKDNIEAAISYLLRTMDEHGCLGVRFVYDFPNYTTALTLLAILNYQPREIEVISRGKPDRWQEYIKRMINYLKNAQHDEDFKLDPSNNRYGGWGFHGSLERISADLEAGNISVTSYVLDALKATKASETDDAFKKALIYIKRCQNLSPDTTLTRPYEDGGFRYTPTLSKGHAEYKDSSGKTYEYFPSYGSATCDGLLSLISCDVSTDDRRFQSALEWMKKNFTAETNPGFKEKSLSEGFYYYYIYSLANLVDKLEIQEKRIWAGEIAKKVIELQKPDGSWVNSSPIMREDNPFIATGFGLLALNKVYPWIR